MEGPLVTDETSLGGSDIHQAVGLGGAGRRPGESERWRMPPEDPGSAREDERDRRQLGERARHMASQVRERLPNVRGYVPSRDELRRRTHELRHTTEDHPA